MKKDFKISEEEGEAVVKGLERGMGEHIKRQQISRRGFIKAMAGLGAMATTLTLPTGTPALKEAVKLPWVGLPARAGGGIGLYSQVHAGKGKRPYEIVWDDWEGRFNYDLRGAYGEPGPKLQQQFYDANPDVQQLYQENAQKYGADFSSPGLTWKDRALDRASWTFMGLIGRYAGFVGGPSGHIVYGNESPWLGISGTGLTTPVGGSGTKWEASPEEAAKVAKKAARFYQADLVGITKIDDDHRWTYSQSNGQKIFIEDVDQPYIKYDEENNRIGDVIPSKCKWCLVMAFEQEHDAMKTRDVDGYSTATSNASTGIDYSRQNFAHTIMAEFFRYLGYTAIPLGNDTALSVPYAIDSGLAEGARSGLAAVPEYGPEVRLCKVYTDLPMEEDPWQTFGMSEFCTICKKCAKACPMGTIEMEEKKSTAPEIYYTHNGPVKWRTHHTKCNFGQRYGGVACHQCCQTCPFGKGPSYYHDVARWIIKNIPSTNSFVLWLETTLGYGEWISAEEWWKRPVSWSHGTRIPNRQPWRRRHEP